MSWGTGTPGDIPGVLGTVTAPPVPKHTYPTTLRSCGYFPSLPVCVYWYMYVYVTVCMNACVWLGSLKALSAGSCTRSLPPFFMMVLSQLVESSKQKSEKQLNEKREKVMLELEKLRTRVDEFNDYGELDTMQQYVQDVVKVQRRIAEVQEQIVWINKVGGWGLWVFLHSTSGTRYLVLH